MKKIGIFLGYGPEQPIKNQGIGRLLAFITTGLIINNETQLIIAAPKWYKNFIIELLEDNQINPQKIELILTDGTPYFIRIKNMIDKFRKSDKKVGIKRLQNFFRVCKSFSFNIITRWLTLSSTFQFIITGILLASTAIIATPFALIIVFLYLCVRLTQYFIKKLTYLENKTRFKIYKREGQTKLTELIYRMYHQLCEFELEKLVKLINKRSDIPIWFVPSLFWPAIETIHAKKVVAAPDIVFVDFPTQFVHHTFKTTYHKIVKTISGADHLICYSEYVKQKHLVEAFSVNPTKISVIEHGLTDLNIYFDLHQTEITQSSQALRIIQDYQNLHLKKDVYLSNYPFGNMRYIIYSSQIRPHKNFMNLIKAYEILLRERFINIKLILTADIKSSLEVMNYIKNRHLQNDVISLPNVPTDVLAALNHLAVCAVNPTLFEGGFPFTFTEAYSVGTPSVMSHIPMTTDEIHDDNLVEHMLFDPFNINDMVNKIEWAVKNRADLLKMQEPLYLKLKKRTWDVVAKEYVNVLEECAQC